MRKAVLPLLLLSLVSSPFAAWYNPVTIGKVQVKTTGRVFFQTTGFEGTRWWTFDGGTVGGKNLFTVLMTARTANLPIRFEGTTAYTNSDRPTTDTYNCNTIQYE